MEPDPDPAPTLEIRRFECGCGRHVATEKGSQADVQGCCSRCRRNRARLVETTLSR